MTESEEDVPIVDVGLGEDDVYEAESRQKKGRGRPSADRAWDELEGCWTNTRTGEREAPFQVGDPVSALWVGNKKTAAGFYDATVSKLDMEKLHATVAWADGTPRSAVRLVQICPGHGKLIKEDGTVTTRTAEQSPRKSLNSSQRPEPMKKPPKPTAPKPTPNPPSSSKKRGVGDKGQVGMGKRQRTEQDQLEQDQSEQGQLEQDQSEQGQLEQDQSEQGQSEQDQLEPGQLEQGQLEQGDELAVALAAVRALAARPIQFPNNLQEAWELHERLTAHIRSLTY